MSANEDTANPVLDRCSESEACSYMSDEPEAEHQCRALAGPMFTDDEDEDGDDHSDSDFCVETCDRSSVSSTTIATVQSQIADGTGPAAGRIKLPASSDDLPIPANMVMDCLAVYETLIRFCRILQLTPFLFEDFCSAMYCSFQSPLLSEVHMVLLKLMQKDNEESGVTFVQPDAKSCYDIMVHCVDLLTWSAVLGLYADACKWPANVCRIIKNDYPFGPIEDRLQVLTFMTNAVMDTSVIRKQILMQETEETALDEYCRKCNKKGLLRYCSECCGGCHLGCAGPSELLDGKFLCGLCSLNKLVGVNNCKMPSRATVRSNSRLLPLGRDSDRNHYWVLARRLVIESSCGMVSYYSTVEQFKSVMTALREADTAHASPVEYEVVSASPSKRFRKSTHVHANAQLLSSLSKLEADIIHDLQMTTYLTLERLNNFRPSDENTNTDKLTPPHMYLEQLAHAGRCFDQSETTTSRLNSVANSEVSSDLLGPVSSTSEAGHEDDMINDHSQQKSNDVPNLTRSDDMEFTDDVRYNDDGKHENNRFVPQIDGAWDCMTDDTSMTDEDEDARRCSNEDSCSLGLSLMSPDLTLKDGLPVTQSEAAGLASTTIESGPTASFQHVLRSGSGTDVDRAAAVNNDGISALIPLIDTIQREGRLVIRVPKTICEMIEKADESLDLSPDASDNGKMDISDGEDNDKTKKTAVASVEKPKTLRQGTRISTGKLKPRPYVGMNAGEPILESECVATGRNRKRLPKTDDTDYEAESNLESSELDIEDDMDFGLPRRHKAVRSAVRKSRRKKTATSKRKMDTAAVQDSVSEGSCFPTDFDENSNMTMSSTHSGTTSNALTQSRWKSTKKSSSNNNAARTAKRVATSASVKASASKTINDNQADELFRDNPPQAAIVGRDPEADSILDPHTFFKDFDKLSKLIGLGPGKRVGNMIIRSAPENVSPACCLPYRQHGYHQDGLYRLGDDLACMQYRNHYNGHPMANCRTSTSMPKDLSKILARRYCLSSEFQYGLDLVSMKESWRFLSGHKSHILRMLCISLLSLESYIPAPFMQTAWHVGRLTWARRVAACTTARHLAVMLLDFEKSIKPFIFNPAYRENVACLHLQRETPSMKEEKRKEESTNRKRMEIELYSRTAVIAKGLRPSICRMRGEEYRQIGGGWCWNKRDLIFASLFNSTSDSGDCTQTLVPKLGSGSSSLQNQWVSLLRVNLPSTKKLLEMRNYPKAESSDAVDCKMDCISSNEDTNAEFQAALEATSPEDRQFFQRLLQGTTGLHPLLQSLNVFPISIENELASEYELWQSNGGRRNSERIALYPKSRGHGTQSKLDSLVTRRQQLQSTLKSQLDVSLLSLRLKLIRDSKSITASGFALDQSSVAEQKADDLLETLLRDGIRDPNGDVVINYAGDQFRFAICLKDSRLPFNLNRHSSAAECVSRSSPEPQTAADVKEEHNFVLEYNKAVNSTTPQSAVPLFVMPSRLFYKSCRRGGVQSIPGFKESRQGFWRYPCGKPVNRTAWLIRTLSATTVSAVALQMKCLWVNLRLDAIEQTLSMKGPMSSPKCRILDRREADASSLFTEYQVAVKQDVFNVDVTPQSKQMAASRSLASTTKVEWVPERVLPVNLIMGFYISQQRAAIAWQNILTARRLARVRFPEDTAPVDNLDVSGPMSNNFNISATLVPCTTPHTVQHFDAMQHPPEGPTMVHVPHAGTSLDGPSNAQHSPMINNNNNNNNINNNAKHDFGDFTPGHRLATCQVIDMPFINTDSRRSGTDKDCNGSAANFSARTLGNYPDGLNSSGAWNGHTDQAPTDNNCRDCTNSQAPGVPRLVLTRQELYSINWTVSNGSSRFAASKNHRLRGSVSAHDSSPTPVIERLDLESSLSSTQRTPLLSTQQQMSSNKFNQPPSMVIQPVISIKSQAANERSAQNGLATPRNRKLSFHVYEPEPLRLTRRLNPDGSVFQVHEVTGEISELSDRWWRRGQVSGSTCKTHTVAGKLSNGESISDQADQQSSNKVLPVGLASMKHRVQCNNGRRTPWDTLPNQKQRKQEKLVLQPMSSILSDNNRNIQTEVQTADAITLVPNLNRPLFGRLSTLNPPGRIVKFVNGRLEKIRYSLVSPIKLSYDKQMEMELQLYQQQQQYQQPIQHQLHHPYDAGEYQQYNHQQYEHQQQYCHNSQQHQLQYQQPEQWRISNGDSGAIKSQITEDEANPLSWTDWNQESPDPVRLFAEEFPIPDVINPTSRVTMDRPHLIKPKPRQFSKIVSSVKCLLNHMLNQIDQGIPRSQTVKRKYTPRSKNPHHNNYNSNNTDRPQKKEQCALIFQAKNEGSLCSIVPKTKMSGKRAVEKAKHVSHHNPLLKPIWSKRKNINIVDGMNIANADHPLGDDVNCLRNQISKTLKVSLEERRKAYGGKSIVRQHVSSVLPRGLPQLMTDQERSLCHLPTHKLSDVDSDDSDIAAIAPVAACKKQPLGRNQLSGSINGVRSQHSTGIVVGITRKRKNSDVSQNIHKSRRSVGKNGKSPGQKAKKAKKGSDNSSAIRSPSEDSQKASEIVEHHTMKTTNLAGEQKITNKGLKQSHSKKSDDHKNKVKKEGDLVCICQTPYDKNEFYVGCDHCENWFHGSCVGISKLLADEMESFTCVNCAEPRLGIGKTDHSDANKIGSNVDVIIYCTCRKPYDKSRFYVGCDRCQDWFHGECVGVTPDEAEHMDKYFCPACCKETEQVMELTLSKQQWKKVAELVEELKLQDLSWPFLAPVNAVRFPQYYALITEPMDLTKLKRRTQAGKYRCLSEFVKDATKIFDNCRVFNTVESVFWHCADGLERHFVRSLTKIKRNLALDQMPKVPVDNKEQKK